MSYNGGNRGFMGKLLFLDGFYPESRCAQCGVERGYFVYRQKIYYDKSCDCALVEAIGQLDPSVFVSFLVTKKRKRMKFRACAIDNVTTLEVDS